MVRTTPIRQKQPVKKKSFVVTPVYDLLLRDLNTLQRAIAEQLTRLNYKMGMLTTVKQRLKDLMYASISGQARKKIRRKTFSFASICWQSAMSLFMPCCS